MRTAFDILCLVMGILFLWFVVIFLAFLLLCVIIAAGPIMWAIIAIGLAACGVRGMFQLLSKWGYPW